MKIDLTKFIILIWMLVTCYFMFEMWRDLGYMTDLIHSYIRMAVENIRH